jgi:protease-4
MAKKSGKKGFRWGVFVAVGSCVLVFFVFAGLVVSFFSGEKSFSGNVALIEVNGEISTSVGSLFSDIVSSGDVAGLIKDAEDDTFIKAIIISVNSPGGSPVGGEEIVRQIKQSNKPVVAFIRDVGASAGYWVASACDYVVASPLSVVGSVGVRSDYFDFSGLLKEYNVSYVALHSGEFKDSGNPFRIPRDDELARLRGKTKIMHDYFVNDVALNRNLSAVQVDEIKKADFYVGLQAQELGLIDKLGGLPEAEAYIGGVLGIAPEVVVFSSSESFFDLFAGAFSGQSYAFGRGFGDALFRKDYLFAK